jgi:hypothetical protein
MPIPEIEEFAKLLVQHVRDVAIQNCDRQLRPDAKSPVAKRWRRVLAGAKPEIPEVMISDCTDKTVSCLLTAIDQGVLRISFTGSSGRTIDLSEDGLGELCGWYNGSGGWRAMYSKERFADDCSNLKL